MAEKRSRREENVEATRAALLAAARTAFAAVGYSSASLEDIAREARVTTGAIYHHFGDKKGLFQAAAEQLEAELLSIAAAIQEPDPWQRLRRGFDALVVRCAEPDVQRILFVEAPQVMGAEEWREIELRYAYGGMRAALAKLQAAGQIDDHPIDLIARTVLSLLREASAELAGSPRGRSTKTRINVFIDAMLEALRPNSQGRG